MRERDYGTQQPVSRDRPHRVGHYAGYNEVGRTEVDPLPIDPDFKEPGSYWLFALYPIMSPENMRGAGFIRYRYADPAKADDIWSWNTGARRLRRFNEGMMSDAVTGAGCRRGWRQSGRFDPDHYSGFNAKVEEYNYKFLGEKTMLGVVQCGAFAGVTCATDGGGSACPGELGDAPYVYR